MHNKISPVSQASPKLCQSSNHPSTSTPFVAPAKSGSPFCVPVPQKYIPSLPTTCLVHVVSSHLATQFHLKVALAASKRKTLCWSGRVWSLACAPPARTSVIKRSRTPRDTSYKLLLFDKRKPCSASGPKLISNANRERLRVVLCVISVENNHNSQKI